ncbi:MITOCHONDRIAL CARDIOLIPIN HYDROLASE [Ceraceosorus bombacis]|uniref:MITOCHONDRIAL CARDIOLIPIN HYDROLASE n=1 Tax=Ceraceosorus bombacis TaxID=401625 RepID=A0A0P1BJC0_9BASI|nr:MITOCHONDRIAL CARDIOLIPIN HYDROLASE [Ceraceosorus bombacis]
MAAKSTIFTPSATKATREKAEKEGVASSSEPALQHATITSAVAADPKLAPRIAEKRLFPPPTAARRGLLRFKIKEQLEEGRSKGWNWHKGAVHACNVEPEEDELQKIRDMYGYKSEAEGGPGRLYLMMLADCLLPLPRHPMSGVVSPPLLATTGIVPFSIFSTGPDIIGHYYDCIVAARREVVLLTNYWQGGKNVNRISEALRELDKRHGERRAQAAKTAGKDADALPKPTIEERIIVKIMWDRGPRTLADLFRLRKPVPPGMWKENGLPEEDQVPNIHIEVLNYHRPLMGTFHAKLLLVDRLVALINSNNIQDRPNIEACTRLEGDVVNSVYDHALISWGNALRPPLPCLGSPAPKVPSQNAFAGGEFSSLPAISTTQLKEMAQAARARLLEEDQETEEVSSPTFGPPRRRSFAEVVDVVMQSRREQSGHAATPHAGPNSGDANLAAGATEQHTSAASGEANVEDARRAGQLWAQKVLRERFGHLNLPNFGSSNPSTPTAASAPALPSSPEKAVPTTTGHTPPASPSFGPRRHFADVVEALMKKEGIKPNLWTEGALDAFGLGPSSSRNVAEDARRSRAARGGAKDAAARGISVPKVVAEEPSTVDELNLDNTSQPAHADGAPAINTEQSSEKVEGEIADVDAPSSDFGSSATAQRLAQGDSLEPISPPEDALSPHQASSSGGDDDESAKVAGTSDGHEEGTPGTLAYRQKLKRTASIASRVSAKERLAAITKSLDFANLSQVKGEITAEQLAAMSQAAGVDPSKSGPGSVSASEGAAASEVIDFNPFIFHKPHAPVPMALVNRRPHGTPGHNDIRNAQDAAWLAGFRYAKRHVFIQSPTLNATPIKHAILHACRRGVRVELWLGLGFNDKSESMPFQGGTNEQVVTRLYRQLRREGKGDEDNLEIYWYTGKDMTRPLNAVRKQRNCHVKYAQFDDQVAIIGSGNQDTQSWYHSQEINVMLDSKEIVKEWNDGLRRNQSTELYGRVDTDGIWRGRHGKETVDKGGDD